MVCHPNVDKKPQASSESRSASLEPRWPSTRDERAPLASQPHILTSWSEPSGNNSAHAFLVAQWCRMQCPALCLGTETYFLGNRGSRQLNQALLGLGQMSNALKCTSAVAASTTTTGCCQWQMEMWLPSNKLHNGGGASLGAELKPHTYEPNVLSLSESPRPLFTLLFNEDHMKLPKLTFNFFHSPDWPWTSYPLPSFPQIPELNIWNRRLGSSLTNSSSGSPCTKGDQRWLRMNTYPYIWHSLVYRASLLRDV